MKIKVSELTGSALNWAIMQILGNAPYYIDGQWVDGQGKASGLTLYASDANLAVALFEKYKITTNSGRRGDEEGQPTGWTAWAYGYEDIEFEAETLIEAGLRCAVGINVGDEIDVPWMKL